MKHICISRLGQHWFRWWLVTCSVPSHFRNHWLLIAEWTLPNICKTYKFFVIAIFSSYSIIFMYRTLNSSVYVYIFMDFDCLWGLIIHYSFSGLISFSLTIWYHNKLIYGNKSRLYDTLSRTTLVVWQLLSDQSTPALLAICLCQSYTDKLLTSLDKSLTSRQIWWGLWKVLTSTDIICLEYYL